MTDQTQTPRGVSAEVDAVPCTSLGRTVCVFASARSPLPCPEDGAEARVLGRLLGESGYPIMLGGRHVGLLSQVYAGAEEGKGRIHVAYLQDSWMLDSPPRGILQSLICDPVERLGFFLKTASAFVALPGGIGTLNEIAAVIVSKQLNRIELHTPLFLHRKHEPVTALIGQFVGAGYVDAEIREAWRFFRDAEHCLKLLDDYFGRPQRQADQAEKPNGKAVS